MFGGHRKLVLSQAFSMLAIWVLVATHAAAEVPLISQAETDDARASYSGAWIAVVERDRAPPATPVAQKKAEENACGDYASAFLAGLEYGSGYASKIPGWKFKCEHSPECKSTKKTIENARGISALKCDQP
jgi:hypothetical protein